MGTKKAKKLCIDTGFNVISGTFKNLYDNNKLHAYFYFLCNALYINTFKLGKISINHFLNN